MALKRVINFLLILFILFADSGQTIYAHTCLKSKHTHLSIGTPKHCCSEKKETGNCIVKKSSCCEVSSKYLKLNFVSEQTPVNETVPGIAVSCLPTFFLPVFNPIVDENKSNAPPSLAVVKASKEFTQIFRI